MTWLDCNCWANPLGRHSLIRPAIWGSGLGGKSCLCCTSLWQPCVILKKGKDQPYLKHLKSRPYVVEHAISDNLCSRELENLAYNPSRLRLNSPSLAFFYLKRESILTSSSNIYVWNLCNIIALPLQRPTQAVKSIKVPFTLHELIEWTIASEVCTVRFTLELLYFVHCISLGLL